MPDSLQPHGSLHYLPEFAQTHVHRVSDAIQPSHPLLLPSPPAPSLSNIRLLFSKDVHWLWQLPGVISNPGHFELYSWLKVQVTCSIYLDQKMYCEDRYTFSGGNSTTLLPTSAKLGFRFLWCLVPCEFLFFHLLYIEGIIHWSPSFLKRFITVSNWYWSLIS